MNDDDGGPGSAAEGASSIFWLELFFDLVAVAAMVVLASALEEHAGWQGIGIFSVTFAAIWTCWSSLALYVNVANERAERRTLVLGMAGIAVMAASLLHLDEHANTFAIAFVAIRLVTMRASFRSGRVLEAWPLAQLGGYTAPWIISLWVPTPWKYWLWAAALVIDLVTQVLRRDTQEQLDRLEERQSHDRPGGRDLPRGRTRPTLVATAVREHHLSERFGTFVIIVLGESVLQLVRAASETTWTSGMWGAATAGFVILVCIWRLTFAYGFSAAPGQHRESIDLRLAMPVHLVMTGSLVVLAAALGEIVRHADHHVDGTWGWIAAAALSVYILTTLVSGLVGGVPRRWLWGWGVPTLAAAMLLGAFSAHIAPVAFVWLLALPVGWLVAYGRRVGGFGELGIPGSSGGSGG